MDNWLAGLKTLGACCKDPERTSEEKVIRGAAMLEDLGHLSDEEWARAVATCRRGEWFPSTNELLKAARPDGPSAIARAGEVYAEIAEAYMCPIAWESSLWSPRVDAVEAQWGAAAKSAFLAAGGARAFEYCEPENEPFRLKHFREAYVEAAKAEPLALMPAAAHGRLK
jgi:hypothetical protein